MSNASGAAGQLGDVRHVDGRHVEERPEEGRQRRGSGRDGRREDKVQAGGSMVERASGEKASGGLLLRLFKSECFDSYFHMFYLYHREELGVHDYLVNLLYRRPDEEIHFYLPQLCQLGIRRPESSLSRFILDKSARSMHLALKSNWFFTAALEDKIPGMSDVAKTLREETEMAVVNSKPPGVAQHSLEAAVGAGLAKHLTRTPDLFLRKKITRYLSRKSANASKREAERAALFLLKFFPPSAASSGASSSANAQASADERKAPLGAAEYRPSTSPAPPPSPSNPVASEAVSPGVDLPDLQITSPLVSPSAVNSKESEARTVIVKEVAPTSHMSGESLMTPLALSVPTVGGPLHEPPDPSGSGEHGGVDGEGTGTQSTNGQISVSAQAIVAEEQATVKKKGKIAPGFITAFSTMRLEGSRVRIPSAYQRLGSPFVYSSFSRESQGVLLNDHELQHFIIKHRRCEYFGAVGLFISLLIELSDKAVTEPDREKRSALIQQCLRSLDEWLFCRRTIVAASEGLFAMTGLVVPLTRFGVEPETSQKLTGFSSTGDQGMDPQSAASLPTFSDRSGSAGTLSTNESSSFLVQSTPTALAVRPAKSRFGSTQIVHIIVEECKVYSSKKRAPFLLLIELADLDEDLQNIQLKPSTSGGHGGGSARPRKDGDQGSTASDAGAANSRPFSSTKSGSASRSASASATGRASSSGSGAGFDTGVIHPDLYLSAGRPDRDQDPRRGSRRGEGEGGLTRPFDPVSLSPSPLSSPLDVAPEVAPDVGAEVATDVANTGVGRETDGLTKSPEAPNTALGLARIECARQEIAAAAGEAAESRGSGEDLLNGGSNEGSRSSPKVAAAGTSEELSDLTWQHMVVLKAVLTDVKQRGLFIPPFLQRPLTPFEIREIEDPRRRDVSCSYCLPSDHREKVSAMKEEGLEGGEGEEKEEREEEGDIQSDKSEGKGQGAREEQLEGFPFTCPKCHGSKIFYEPIAKNSYLHALRRSLGVNMEKKDGMVSALLPKIPPYVPTNANRASRLAYPAQPPPTRTNLPPANLPPRVAGTRNGLTRAGEVSSVNAPPSHALSNIPTGNVPEPSSSEVNVEEQGARTEPSGKQTDPSNKQVDLNGSRKRRGSYILQQMGLSPGLNSNPASPPLVSAAPTGSAGSARGGANATASASAMAVSDQQGGKGQGQSQGQSQSQSQGQGRNAGEGKSTFESSSPAPTAVLRNDNLSQSKNQSCDIRTTAGSSKDSTVGRTADVNQTADMYMTGGVSGPARSVPQVASQPIPRRYDNDYAGTDSSVTTYSDTELGPHPGESPEQMAQRIRLAVWGELWAAKVKRLRKASPYGRLKSWQLGAVLVKGGDDLRQELLASQLMRMFKSIFEKAALPLWLRPYEILVTGSHSGIMEFVEGTQSIDAIKRKFNVDSIHRVFEAAFADNIHLARRVSLSDKMIPQNPKSSA